ncbi:MAG TPA: hypothetical protein VMO26_26915 [Vicinamibacterales bacterium]|nr:hypothetical protein [Vicinamibacterales bacterium]
MMKLSATALALTFSITALVAQGPLAVLPDENTSELPSEFLRFDFKTTPTTSSIQR